LRGEHPREDAGLILFLQFHRSLDQQLLEFRLAERRLEHIAAP
jgi:hypothetical protein